MIKKLLLLSILALTILASAIDVANENVKKEDVQIGIYEQLGKKISLNTKFTDQNGKEKTIKELMNGRATIISLNYYKCPGICGAQFASVSSLVDRLDVPLDEYQVLTISIEPEDTPQLALDKQDTFYDSMVLKQDFPRDKWSFLVGSQDSIKEFASSVGYKYKKQIGKNGVVDYIHAGALIVVSPSGIITRYIYGMDYSKFDVKMALIEADEGRVSAARVQALKLCFAYDAQAKKYIFQWEKIVGGFLFLGVLTFFLYLIITGRKET
jgi:protein SCO1/2